MGVSFHFHPYLDPPPVSFYALFIQPTFPEGLFLSSVWVNNGHDSVLSHCLLASALRLVCVCVAWVIRNYEAVW